MNKVCNITGGYHGRFAVSTMEASYILKGDDLEEIKIGDDYTGGAGNGDVWILGDGWELWASPETKIYGRGKSKCKRSS